VRVQRRTAMVMRLALAAQRSSHEAAAASAAVSQGVLHQQRLQFRVAKAEEFLEHAAADAQYTAQSMQVLQSKLDHAEEWVAIVGIQQQAAVQVPPPIRRTPGEARWRGWVRWKCCVVRLTGSQP
jgi:hypothetical protein